MVWCFCKCTDAFRTNKDYMTNLIGNVLTGSCYKRNRCSGCNDICLFSNDIANEISEKLDIEIAGVCDGRFIRLSTSKKIYGIHSVFSGKSIDYFVPFH